MVGDYPIVHQMDLLCLVEVRVGIAVGPLPASCPSCMSNPAPANASLCQHFLDDSVDATRLVSCVFVSIFDQFVVIPCKGCSIDSSTVIPSVFE